MKEEIIELKEDLSASDLYSEDLAPVPKSKRTWTKWHLAALWVGMAVCIPTYLLASYMILDGMSWLEALIIIGLANVIITVPMVLNGHAGVKYGIPFPVIGRSSFGINGIHIASIVRAIVACGWFGIQTWIGGLAFYAIYCALTGADASVGLSMGKFIGFGFFWLMNIYFIWKGTESIKFLEQYAAPILVLIGVGMIAWGATQAGGFGIVLDQSKQLEVAAAETYQKDNVYYLDINPIKNKEGQIKASEYKIIQEGNDLGWQKIPVNTKTPLTIPLGENSPSDLKIQLRKQSNESSIVAATIRATSEKGFSSKLWSYLLWLTIMVGFWATMSLSIADITRYAATQKAQVAGQFIGLPGTMLLYSFVGIFVTCAAVINFDDILIGSDAPWDPVSLLSKFENPVVVVLSQIAMIIATLSTNIAANVIAPANAFSNLSPKNISFRSGGIITGVIGILICPWLLLNEISGILIFISGLLGPVLGIMLSDYYLVRKKKIQLAELYKKQGAYTYSGGFNPAAIVALVVGVGTAIIGLYVPALEALYKLSWFSGFLVSFVIYYLMMRRSASLEENNNLITESEL
ncbi:MAG: cytosine/uracil/thiamine/allantoin permease [Polaribacter sp.]|jgi:cytosine/uracil/thiamine/allantoin permease